MDRMEGVDRMDMMNLLDRDRRKYDI